MSVQSAKKFLNTVSNVEQIQHALYMLKWDNEQISQAAREHGFIFDKADLEAAVDELFNDVRYDESFQLPISAPANSKRGTGALGLLRSVWRS